MKKTELKMRTATCLILHTVAGIAGITALFLPFTMDISPVAYVFNILPSESSDTDVWLYLPLAIPFFLSVFVSAAYVRWMISGLISRLERTIAYVMSSMMALGTLYFMKNVFLYVAQSLEVQACLTVVVPLVLLIVGVYILIKNLKNKGPKEVGAIMAMQIVYLSNALLCLIFFFKDEENWLIAWRWHLQLF